VLGTSAPQWVLARPGEAHKSLALPLSQADKDRAKSAIADEHGRELTQIMLELSAAVTGHVLPHWEALTRADPGQRRPLTQLGGESAHDMVERLGNRLTCVMEAAHATALRVCTTKVTTRRK
jgi:hypothetical protein